VRDGQIGQLPQLLQQRVALVTAHFQVLGVMETELQDPSVAQDEESPRIPRADHLQPPLNAAGKAQDR
jgi:hypothetical protein